MSHFDSFVIFAEMRTGSNLLEASLNALPGVACHGEAFNPVLIGYPNRTELLGVSMAARDADPSALLQRIGAAEGLNGFRYFHDHDPRVLETLLNDRRCAKIILTRNPIESYVSLKIARATGQWKLGDAKHRKQARASFDADEFEAHLNNLQAFQVALMHALQTSGQTAFYIDYEDTRDLAVLNGLARFLGVDATLAALPDGMVPQNPEELGEKVANFAGMTASLARLDRFNLSRTPNFEPRRGPGVPGFVAAKGAGLLYMPIRPGQDSALRDWLAKLGSGGLEESFTQKTLRQWKRARPGHRSFTVVRHPLARAHLAFATVLDRPGQAETRDLLRKHYKLPIPPDPKIATMDVDDYRAALLAFLKFLKPNLNGQTSLRVDPIWASQTILVQGFAQFAPPDLIIRDNDIAADLAYLAQTAGIAAPQFIPQAETGVPFALAAVHDAALEAAAHDAYTRDYVNFGYQEWRP